MYDDDGTRVEEAERELAVIDKNRLKVLCSEMKNEQFVGENRTDRSFLIGNVF